MSCSTFSVHITLTNEDAGYYFSDWREDIEDWQLDDNGQPPFGVLFRAYRAEFGRCQSSVYVDVDGGPPRRVGWYFVSRQRYEDSDESYLRGAWVVVQQLIAPASPAVFEPWQVSA